MFEVSNTAFVLAGMFFAIGVIFTVRELVRWLKRR